MTTLRKLLLGGLVVAALGGPALHQAVTLRARTAVIVQLGRDLAARRQRLAQANLARLAAPAVPVSGVASTPAAMAADELPATGDATFDAELRRLAQNVQKMKSHLAGDPRQQIPELRFLADTAWFEVAAKHPDLGAPDALQIALSELRLHATQEFSRFLAGALQVYLKAHDNQIPAHVADLKPYCVTAIDDTLLAGYEMSARGSAAGLPSYLPLIARRASAADYFAPPGLTSVVIGISLDGAIEQVLKSPAQLGAHTVAEIAAIEKALHAYLQAHPNSEPTDAADLVPYFENKADAERFLKAAAAEAGAQK